MRANRVRAASGISSGLDPHFENVVSLLHFNGDFSDETGRVWTPAGDASISDVNTLFGSGAYESSGSGYLTTPLSSDFAFGTSDFTVEMSVYFKASGAYETLFHTGSYESGQLSLRKSDSDQLQMYHSGAAAMFVTAGIACPIGEYVPIAVSRVGGITRLLQDGVVVGITSVSYSVLSSNGAVTIGQRLGLSLPTAARVFIDEFRCTKGAGRYNGAYTPASSEFPNQ